MLEDELIDWAVENVVLLVLVVLEEVAELDTVGVLFVTLLI
ncbi:hypothetical protein [Secundilactobacillus silagei]|nr:hypothetical protein [Secundilactobacillus silagei]